MDIAGIPFSTHRKATTLACHERVVKWERQNSCRAFSWPRRFFVAAGEENQQMAIHHFKCSQHRLCPAANTRIFTIFNAVQQFFLGQLLLLAERTNERTNQQTCLLPIHMLVLHFQQLVLTKPLAAIILAMYSDLLIFIKWNKCKIVGISWQNGLQKRPRDISDFRER